MNVVEASGTTFEVGKSFFGVWDKVTGALREWEDTVSIWCYFLASIPVHEVRVGDSLSKARRYWKDRGRLLPWDLDQTTVNVPKRVGTMIVGGGRRDWSWVLGSITRLIELIWLSHEFLRVLLISCFFSASSLFHSNLPAIQVDANQRLQVLRLRATRRLHSAVLQGLGGSFRLTEPVDLEKSLLAP